MNLLRAAHDWLQSAPARAGLLEALEAVEQDRPACEVFQARIALVCIADEYHGGPWQSVGLATTLRLASSRKDALALLEHAAQRWDTTRDPAERSEPGGPGGGSAPGR